MKNRLMDQAVDLTPLTPMQLFKDPSLKLEFFRPK